ncbi:uncharacterized protein E0L32_001231 [Thyridium curvatum]|uniref:Major facilitator superfamily (MFS) profile domain-containing protein n=1 Tax=Thyridium curvatum TaxID=1093900 RepID=A0A507AU66_9PEZI|nr:uncharacterized protein E0L32_001231 [Thyridium curvatum]TPX10034.1 hypothetical protein E0L32_001231 [Thyridium curvatum]
MASPEKAAPVSEGEDVIQAAHREQDIQHVAERGQMATDKYGQPLFQFDAKAESRLRTKIDLFIVPTVAVLYLFCFIDRANIGKFSCSRERPRAPHTPYLSCMTHANASPGNARLAGLEKDLHLKGNDYNTVLSVFYISYIIFEIPSNILCKWVGPGWFLPAISLGSSLGTAFVKDMPAVCGVRFLLGIFEAGMLPGIAYYLSRWYRRAELAFRLSLYIVMAPLAGAFGGLLASAILKLSHFGGLHAWRMIFAIEGIITIGLSLIAFITLTDRPSTARWLTPDEQALAIARVKSERVGATHVLDGIDTIKLKRGLTSPLTIATSFVFLLNNVTVQGLAFFAPTIVATIYPDKSTIQKQLYTVPPYVVGAFFTVLIPLLSWRFDRRQIFMVISAPLTMVGYIMFLASNVAKVRYAATFLIALSAFSLGALTNAQVSANVVTDTARSSAIGMNVMMGNIGGLIATWSFLWYDGPDYHIGNGLNLATSSTVLIVTILTLLWMKRDNKKRAQRNVEEELTGLTDKEIEDLDWKHPAFKWRP